MYITSAADTVVKLGNKAVYDNVLFPYLRCPRTSDMAALLDDLNHVTERLQPYLQQYHQLMRDDPVLEADVRINA
jgi:ABC-type iron transport system FetAB ATPase subunit